MKKERILLLTAICALSASVCVVVPMARNTNMLSPVYGVNECVEGHHSGHHYAAKAASRTEPGNVEFWACCECQHQYTSNPGGSFDNPGEYSGPALDVSHPAYAAPSALNADNFRPTNYSGDGNYSFVQDEGREVLKLNANGGVNWDWNNYNVSTLYGIRRNFPAGEYRVEAEVKLGEVSANQIVYYGSYDKDTDKWIPGYRWTIDLSTCNTTSYTKISGTYTASADYNAMPEIAFGSLSTELTTNSYVLIKSFKFIRKDVSPEHLEFTCYPRGYEYSKSVWTNGVYYSRVADTVSLSDDNGNSCLKVYTTGSDAYISFSQNFGSISVGKYMVSLQVKLGPNATNVNNIGFRNSVNGGGNKRWQGDTQFTLTGLAGSTDWVRLTKIIEVTDDSSVSFSNLDFWIFTHNDTISSVDNYVLIDNVAFSKTNIA